MNNPMMHDFMGIRVVSSPHMPARRPTIALRPGICSAEFEGKMNAWLLETFGTTAVMYVIQTGALGLGPDRQVVVTNPENIRSFEQRLRSSSTCE